MNRIRKIQLLTCFAIPFLAGCNLWAYRGAGYDMETTNQAFYSLDSNTAYFPEDITGKYNIFCYCNGSKISFRDTATFPSHRFKFPPRVFDSCKQNSLGILFFRKGNTGKRYEFLIPADSWSDSARRKIRGLIYN